MRPPRALAAGLAASAAAALSACGGGGGGNPVPANAPPGERVYSDATCGSCHKLKAAGSTGTAGPDLDKTRPSAAVVERFVRKGGSGMPGFTDRLSNSQIREVSTYVAQVAGR